MRYCVSTDTGGSPAPGVRAISVTGESLPVVMIGTHGAFRTAVAVARLAGTDFLQRPISAQRLRAALRRATGAASRIERGDGA